MVQPHSMADDLGRKTVPRMPRRSLGVACSTQQGAELGRCLLEAAGKRIQPIKCGLISAAQPSWLRLLEPTQAVKCFAAFIARMVHACGPRHSDCSTPAVSYSGNPGRPAQGRGQACLMHERLHVRYRASRQEFCQAARGSARAGDNVPSGSCPPVATADDWPRIGLGIPRLSR